jgi:hypothetical protein
MLVSNLNLENITIQNGNRTGFDRMSTGWSLKGIHPEMLLRNGTSLTGSSSITVEALQAQAMYGAVLHYIIQIS